MKDSKLVSILKTFSKEEFKEFEKFIDSPFFSTGRNLKPLYTALKKFYPEFTNKNFTRENVFTTMFADKPYNDTLMRRHFSDMIKMAEEYLVHKGFAEDEIEKGIFLLDEYNKRRVKNLFQPKLKEIKQLLIAMEISEDYFHLKERILETERDYNNKFFQQKNESIMNEQSNNFLIYSLFRMGSIVHNIFVNQGNFNQKHESSLNTFLKSLNIKELINEFSGEKQTDEIIKINLYRLKFLSSDFNDGDYTRLKDLVKRNIMRYNRTSKVALLVTLNDYNFKKTFETGEVKYYEEAFELYEILFSKEMNIYYENNYATVINFRSAIIIANRLGKTGWIKNFLDENICKLAPEFRDNMKHLAFAYICFAEKRYESALKEINEIKFELFTFKLDVKYLLVQVYFEMGYTEQVLSSIDSFKHFMIENSHISEMFRKRIDPFIKAAHELVMIKENYNEVTAGLFRENLYGLYEFAGKSWIIEKLNELKR